MSKIRKTSWGLLMLVSLLVLGACSLTGQDQQPTLDANAIFTAAARTVQANLTQTAAAMPSATQTQPPPASATPELPPLPTLPPLNTTPISGLLPTAAPLFTVAPPPGLATATLAALPASGDKAQWVANTPPDGARVVKGAKFDMRWTMRNVGTTTWNNKYLCRYYSGTRLHEKSQYPLRTTGTKPNDTADCIADAIAPSTTGEYTTTWVITNPEGTNFGVMTLTIKVVNAAVPTTTGTPDLAKICCDANPDNDVTGCDTYVCP